MPRIVVLDSSTLILFHKIEQIDLLKKKYGNLVITPEIAKEFGNPLPQWIEILLETNFRISEKIVNEILSVNDKL